MSGFLLDTHVLLWWLGEPDRVSAEAREVIADASQPVFFSAAGVWEISIKRGLGRLECPDDLASVLDGDGIQVLDVTLPHALALADLPSHHRDPFDRMLVAQARIEDLTLITADDQFRAYDIRWMRA